MNNYEEELRKWQQQYAAAAGAKPADYMSKYAPQMQSAMDQYVNQKPFSYDLNGDALYQQMKDSYARQGKMAMKDSMGQASAMTGGYGSTYGAAVGQQQYNQYMQGLNDNIPALQDRAYQQYMDQGSKYLNQFNLAGQMESQDYGKYRDMLGDWQTDRGFQYGGMQDAQGQVNYQEQFNYGQQRDAVADSQYREQFDYGKSQDQLNYENWQKQFEYGMSQDQLAQQNWQQQYGLQQSQFDYQKQQDQQQQSFSLAMTALQAGKIPPADLLTQAGIDSQTANLMQSIFTKPVTVSKSGSSKSSGKTTITVDQQNDADTLFKAGGENALEAYCTKLENAGIASSAVLKLYNDVVKYNAKDQDYYQQSADPFGEKGL
jgi:hypothetical protein